MSNDSEPLTWEEFERVEMRVGTVLEAAVFEAARRPAYKLLIDFGPLGVRKSSAQIIDLYQPEDLIGRQVIAVVNFPPKQIATMKSECLVLGAIGESKVVTLLSTERKVENGSRVG